MKNNNFIERSLLGAINFTKESILCDEYALKNGFLQQLDPRIKLLSILLFLLAILLSKGLYFIVFLYLIVLILAGLSRIPLLFFLKRSWVFIPLFSLFIALPALFNIFTPGEAWVSFRVFGSFFSITKQGISSASLFFMRVLTSVSFCILLVLTTKQNILLKTLRYFKIPKVFVMTLGMCYRYIYLFIQIMLDTYLAIKSRVGFIHSVKKGQGVVSWNIASFWQRSYRLNQDVYQAMLSRGYMGESFVLEQFKTRALDWLWLSVSVIIFTIVIYLHYLVKV